MLRRLFGEQSASLHWKHQKRVALQPGFKKPLPERFSKPRKPVR
jgi:hypothetical protein